METLIISGIILTVIFMLLYIKYAPMKITAYRTDEDMEKDENGIEFTIYPKK